MMARMNSHEKYIARLVPGLGSFFSVLLRFHRMISFLSCSLRCYVRAWGAAISSDFEAKLLTFWLIQGYAMVELGRRNTKKIIKQNSAMLILRTDFKMNHLLS